MKQIDHSTVINSLEIITIKIYRTLSYIQQYSVRLFLIIIMDIVRYYLICAFIETSRFSSISIIAIMLDLKRDVTNSVQNVTVGLLLVLTPWHAHVRILYITLSLEEVT